MILPRVICRFLLTNGGYPLNIRVRYGLEEERGRDVLEHLEHDDPETPPIARLVVSVPSQNLNAHVIVRLRVHIRQ
jgi:hypothetical protein